MSAALLEAAAVGRLFCDERPTRDSDDGRITLAERLEVTWQSLQAGREAECPLCSSRLRPHVGCDGCGSRLG